MLDEPWLPEEEASAAAKVRQVIAGLSGLGAIEPTADLTALRLTLELEQADDLPRQGRSARGCWWDRWVGAIGLDADVAFMAGLAEGMVPERLHEDGLLPERVRALAAGQLAPLRNTFGRQHRHLLAALAAAPERVASFPRGDLRRSTARLPLRWLPPSLRALAGEPGLHASQCESVSGPWLAGSPFYAASLARAPVLASAHWRVRAAIARYGGGLADALGGCGRGARRGHDRCPGQRPADPLSSRSWPGSLTDRTGGVGTMPARLLSCSACCGWSRSGHRKSCIEISPLESGSLIHEVLDRFITGQSLNGAVPGPGKRWTAVSRSRGSGRSAGAWSRLACSRMHATSISCLLPTTA